MTIAAAILASPNEELLLRIVALLVVAITGLLVSRRLPLERPIRGRSTQGQGWIVLVPAAGVMAFVLLWWTGIVSSSPEWILSILGFPIMTSGLILMVPQERLPVPLVSLFAAYAARLVSLTLSSTVMQHQPSDLKAAQLQLKMMLIVSSSITLVILAGFSVAFFYISRYGFLAELKRRHTSPPAA